jgi:acyl carrier protein
MEYQTTLRTFIQSELIKGKDFSNLTDTDSLIESGIIDSMSIQMLVAYLEKKFSIHVSDDELIPDNFESISAISNFIKTK